MDALERLNQDRFKDDVRDLYEFAPLCRFSVKIYLPSVEDWETDAYFLTRFEAVEHARMMRESNFETRVFNCDRMVEAYE
jgi:hypothetical protein